MTYLLKFPDAYDKHRLHYFCYLGEVWPHRPERRMIAKTTEKKDEAKVFNSEEEAREVLVTAGDPKGWEVVEA
jgi:hypothetical protein